MFTGLPWNLICYSWTWSPHFIQSLSLVGPYGLGILSVFCSCALFSFRLKSENIFIATSAILILVLTFFYGFNRIKNYKEIYIENFDVRIIGTYINQKDKWSESTKDIVRKML